MNLIAWLNLGLALAGGWFWGYGSGMKRATKDYRKAIDQACADYREAAKIIKKLQNRLTARRFILLKQKDAEGKNVPTTGDNK